MLKTELSIVVPTYNERQNIPEMVRLIELALPNSQWEIVFVDDNSPDQTAAVVREIAQRDRRVRIIHRYGRRGLSSACVEGVLSTSSPYIAIMDADLQHDESILGAMLEKLKVEGTDIVVGSRYVAGGGVGTWSRSRYHMSRLATALSVRLTKTPVSDPMSGFMLFRREAFMNSLPHLSTVGFKILPVLQGRWS
jgi:dolichol-phosphate mannosyltransferase